MAGEEEGFRILCNIIFPNGPRSAECCAKILAALHERGYAKVPRFGICYQVKRKLIRLGLVREEHRFFCDGSRRRKVLIVNVEALWRLYQKLSTLKPPPGCLTEEPVEVSMDEGEG